MAIRVGFHVEGRDDLVLRAYLAKLLDVADQEIQSDVLEAKGRGVDFIKTFLPLALRRFYGNCANLAVVGIDNDGSHDVLVEGIHEDPQRPRHWLHEGHERASCRWCVVRRIVEETRPHLHWIPKKPGATWPVVIAVPVEAIEAWLLTTRAITQRGSGELLRAEDLRHQTLKQRLYGRRIASESDIQRIAVPLVQQMDRSVLEGLADFSKSFAQFARQVRDQREAILASEGCW